MWNSKPIDDGAKDKKPKLHLCFLCKTHRTFLRSGVFSWRPPRSCSAAFWPWSVVRLLIGKLFQCRSHNERTFDLCHHYKCSECLSMDHLQNRGNTVQEQLAKDQDPPCVTTSTVSVDQRKTKINYYKLLSFAYHWSADKPSLLNSQPPAVEVFRAPHERMYSLDKHAQSELKLILVPERCSATVTGSAESLQHSFKFFCRRVSNFTLYGTLLGDRAAIPKAQVYPLPRTIWMSRQTWEQK